MSKLAAAIRPRPRRSRRMRRSRRSRNSARSRGPRNRRAGRVALCHGVFDLVHLGHVRHLQAARKRWRRADRHGHGRSLRQQGARPPGFHRKHAGRNAGVARQMSTGSAINHTSSAEPSLDTRPARHLRQGPGLREPDDDVTGKIIAGARRRRAPWRPHRLHPRGDVQLVRADQPPLQHLRSAAARLSATGCAKTAAPQRLLELIDASSDMHVVLVGDTIIDEYQYVCRWENPPKENIVATRYSGSASSSPAACSRRPTTSRASASRSSRHLLGGDDYPRGIHPRNLRPNVSCTLSASPARPTTPQAALCRTRLSAQAVRGLHHERQAARRDRAARRSTAITSERVRDADVVIATDFGHGLIAARARSTR